MLLFHGGQHFDSLFQEDAEQFGIDLFVARIGQLQGLCRGLRCFSYLGLQA